MNQIMAHTQISGGQGGKSQMTPRYIASVAGKDMIAKTYRIQEL